MSDTQAPETQAAGTEQAAGEQGREHGDTFTQADVDKLMAKVRSEERRKATEKFADYDDLKSRAEGAKSVEQQLAELKAQNAKIQRDNLAARIAAANGIAPEDADLFLTGNDEETLTAQAKRLAERESERKKRNNTVPREGNQPRATTNNLREFTRGLFGESA